jgi:hypothetical protein
VENFGVDEILQVGTQNNLVAYISPTTNYTYVNVSFLQVGVEFFNGQFTGSISGTDATSSFAILNGTASDGLFTVNNFTGSISSGSTICLYGTASGVDTRTENSRQYINQAYIDRALIQFDITAISNSIADGTITSASFFLKVKICNEYQLPIDYTIYAYPVSESWVMGNGYMSDGGSDEGASWVYRDFNGGTPWAASGSSIVSNVVCTQSFHYKSADIDMDVTPIVNYWLSNPNKNFGLILISSGEQQTTGSGFTLKYFSEDTNTIYSPLLDVGWSEWSFNTGSFLTASVTITQASGSNSTVQTGSWISVPNGVYGNFIGSALIYETANFITASDEIFTSSFVQQFTGSFSGSFYGIATAQGYYTGSGGFSASFTGSIDGTGSIELTSSAVSGTSVEGYIVGDVSMPSFLGTFSGSLAGLALCLAGTGSGTWLDETYEAYSGYISASGISGDIVNDPIFGNAQGIMTLNSFQVVLPADLHYLYPTSPNEAPYQNILAQNPQFATNYQFLSPYNPLEELWYVWGGDEAGWTTELPLYTPNVFTCSCGVSHSVQVMSGSFTDGVFSGSTFIAYYENYSIIYASMTGSWNPTALYGSNFLIPLPQVTYPHVTAYINGPFVTGRALGLYTNSASISASVTQSITSASFFGQIVDGPFVGGIVSLQLSGSTAGQTSPYAFTSSVQMTSSFLDPLDTGRQFSINLTTLQPTYKAGDIIKINVFARPKYPIKDFGILTQQQAYLVPEFLPTSSYWALKDNQTDEIVVNFDSYTQISCQYPEGNFFLVDTTSLPQERYYRILIRVDDGVQVSTIDTGKTFKITR